MLSIFLVKAERLTFIYYFENFVVEDEIAQNERFS